MCARAIYYGRGVAHTNCYESVTTSNIRVDGIATCQSSYCIIYRLYQYFNKSNNKMLQIRWI